MTGKVPTAVVLRGTIRQLTKEQTTVDAFQSEMLRTKTGAAGALAAAAGMSGIAAGMVAMSMDEMKENAFGVTFEVDGKPVRAVLWDFPFEEGDEVEVVAEELGDHWNAFAVTRPSDRTIALFPHVVSGEIAHYITSASVWLKVMMFGILGGGAVMALVAALNGGGDWGGLFKGLLGGAVIVSLIFAIIGLNISRKYLPFVRIAENVFTALGWQDVKRINLRKRTFKHMKPGDDAALGVFHFRY